VSKIGHLRKPIYLDPWRKGVELKPARLQLLPEIFSKKDEFLSFLKGRTPG
jgi:hypothetical protein